jgi:hypothetical protein
MKNTDINQNGLPCDPDKKKDVKNVIDYLNGFYADHGRMPNSTELDVSLGAGGKVEGSSELIYEIDDQA